MKNLLKYTLLLTIIALALSACDKSGGKEKDDDDDDDRSELLNQKTVEKLIDKYYDDEMTDKDWEKALDIFEAYMDDSIEKSESFIDKSDSLDELNVKVQKYDAKYAYIRPLLNILYSDKMPSDIKEEFEKLSDKYQRKMIRLGEKADNKFGSLEYMDSSVAPYDYSYESESVAVPAEAAMEAYAEACDSAKY